MGIFKIKNIGIWALILLTYSCQSGEIKKLLKECEEVQKEKEEALQTAYEQLENINRIFEQLAAINSQMGNIKINAKQERESPIAKTQIEQIDEFVDNIKKELDKLESDNTQMNSLNNELSKILKHLRTIIVRKEEEVTVLKDDIKKQEQELKHKAIEINQKSDTIASQKIDINEKDKKIAALQIEKWQKMGFELYTIYKEYKDIAGGLFKGKENSRRMNDNKRTVLEKAKNCFIEAASLGSTEAVQNIQQIEEELKSLK